MKIAINGFGRIGRNVLRAYLEYIHEFEHLQIVAINDIADPITLVHLLNYDSTHGRLSKLGVSAFLENNALVLEYPNKRTTTITLLKQPHPEQLPWADLGIDVVLECTGKYRDYLGANKHRMAGAKQVIVGAAPFDRVDACVVVGVNDDTLTPNLPIISSVSCTTQALVPLLWLLDGTAGVSSAMLTEIHAITADQMVLDGAHRDLRRARACGYNIIPTTSSSINATVQVLPHMKNKLTGYSVRVPAINVAMIDITVVLDKHQSTDDLKKLFKNASKQTLAGIMDYTEEPLVSSDFIHDRHSLIIDGGQILVGGRQVKILAWYDNEWGYANRLLDICQILSQKYPD